MARRRLRTTVALCGPPRRSARRTPLRPDRNCLSSHLPRRRCEGGDLAIGAHGPHPCGWKTVAPSSTTICQQRAPRQSFTPYPRQHGFRLAQHAVRGHSVRTSGSLGYPSPRGRRGGKATADASVAVAPPSEPAADANTILQVKVWWAGISPMVWRRVLAPATFTLREFHSVIQVAMGWEGIHLYAFQLGAARYGSKFASGTATR